VSFVDGCVIVYGVEDLPHDFVIMLLVTGSSCKMLQALDHWEGNDVRKLIIFAQKTRKRFDVAEMFILNFLWGSYCGRDDASSGAKEALPFAPARWGLRDWCPLQARDCSFI
jgi:hypothetical protein